MLALSWSSQVGYGPVVINHVTTANASIPPFVEDELTGRATELTSADHSVNCRYCIPTLLDTRCGGNGFLHFIERNQLHFRMNSSVVPRHFAEMREAVPSRAN